NRNIPVHRFKRSTLPRCRNTDSSAWGLGWQVGSMLLLFILWTLESNCGTIQRSSGDEAQLLPTALQSIVVSQRPDDHRSNFITISIHSSRSISLVVDADCERNALHSRSNRSRAASQPETIATRQM